MYEVTGYFYAIRQAEIYDLDVAFTVLVLLMIE